MTRELQITESRLPELERYLVVAHWGMKRFARYTLFLPGVIIVVPDPAACVAVRNESVHLSIKARIIELKAMTNVSFEAGEGAWMIEKSAL